MQVINVLLVDDDPADRRLVKVALQKGSQQLSFKIDSAGRLSEATELISQNRYDIVVLDLGLPDSCGIETVQRIYRANEESPIVVLTGLNDEQAGLEAIRNGASDYLVKGQALEYTLVRTIRYAMERKRIESELKRAVEDQTRLLEEVEAANKELKDFAYIVSHDLKAPLRGIQTLVEWITGDYCDKLDDQGREQLGLLSQRVERMRSLIEGVLQYSRVGRVNEERREVNLNELLAEVIDSLAPRDTISIERETQLPVLVCEATRILQVFQNLLSNAMKYMDKPNGKIKVGCVDEGDFWKFCVADNGPGIEEKNFERVFQIFQTLAPRDEYESTGVGLTVIKKIIELYGGKIWVESEVGKGSTFYFKLPKELADDKPAKAISGSTDSQSNPVTTQQRSPEPAS